MSTLNAPKHQTQQSVIAASIASLPLHAQKDAVNIASALTNKVNFKPLPPPAQRLGTWVIVGHSSAPDVCDTLFFYAHDHHAIATILVVSAGDLTFVDEYTELAYYDVELDATLRQRAREALMPQCEREALASVGIDVDVETEARGRALARAMAAGCEAARDGSVWEPRVGRRLALVARADTEPPHPALRAYYACLAAGSKGGSGGGDAGAPPTSCVPQFFSKIPQPGGSRP